MTTSESRLRELAQATLDYLNLDSPQDKIPTESNDISPFVLLFECNEQGDLTVRVGWPDTDDMPISKSATMMGTMLHQLTSGSWNGALLSAIKAYGADTNQQEGANYILENWSSMIGIQHKNTVCVDPTRVFSSDGSNSD